MILAGDTDGNLGDRAIIFSMCKELRRAHSNMKIQLISDDPPRDRQFFGALTIPKGPVGLPSFIRAARESDLILCGGGGLFQDDSSLVKMPYWAMRLALAKLVGGRIVGYSLGVGPLDYKSSRLFARLAFSCMERISVRDPEAEKTSKPLTSKPVQIVPDPALILPAAPEEEAYGVLRRSSVPMGSPLVGVSARRWFHQYSSLIPHKYAFKYNLRKIPGEQECGRMTSMLARVLDRIVEEHGAHIVFMPTYNVTHESDDRICGEILEKMNSRNSTLLRISNPTLYKAVTGFLSVMLGGRLHPTILAASMGVPIVGLAYNQKFFGFFDLLEMRDRVISVEDFLHNEMTDELATRISKSMMSNSNTISKVLKLKKLIREFNQEILGVYFDPSDLTSSN